MGKKQLVVNAILQQKLLPLYYNDSSEISVDLLHALYDAGIRVVEYTNRGEQAIKNFKALRKTADKKMPGLYLGIGTIKNRKTAKTFLHEGADFIICPTMNIEVAEAVHKEGLLWVPGCQTATEIATAEEAGAELVKIFPGNILGPSYINAIKDIFPALKFMPTGGVEAEISNLKSWFNAGVVAVGMGSRLVTKEIVENRGYERLTRDTSMALQLIQSVTGPFQE